MVVFLSHHWGGNQLNKLNQLHNYTVLDVNMLGGFKRQAQKYKIKGDGVDFISALSLPAVCGIPPVASCRRKNLQRGRVDFGLCTVVRLHFIYGRCHLFP